MYNNVIDMKLTIIKEKHQLSSKDSYIIIGHGKV